jgi:site-specific recombinase XerD
MDQTLWTRSCAPKNPFDDPGYGTTLRSASLEKIAKGYGRWLGFLDSLGWLDPSTNPLDRITRSRLRAFVQDMQNAGNADYTIIGRFSELAMAMKILAPDRDSSWIRKPNGTTIYAILPKRKRVLLVPDSAVLLDWAYDILAAAPGKPTERERLCGFRDGLLLALLSCCGRRLRSVSLMRFGRELSRIGENYRVDLLPEQVKTDVPDRFDLPAALTPYFDRYVGEIRPALLKGQAHEHFWISARSGPWTAKSIQNQVLELSRKRFGTAFGPHRFRHAIATTAPLLDPANPGLAAALLGISQETIDNSYNRSKQNNAVLAFHACLERRRTAIL